MHSAGRGEHNSAVFTAARALGQLAAAGAIDPDHAEQLLTRAAGPIAAGPCDCTPRGLAASIRSGLAYGARRPRHVPTPVEHPDRKGHRMSTDLTDTLTPIDTAIAEPSRRRVPQVRRASRRLTLGSLLLRKLPSGVADRTHRTSAAGRRTGSEH